MQQLNVKPVNLTGHSNQVPHQTRGLREHAVPPLPEWSLGGGEWTGDRQHLHSRAGASVLELVSPVVKLSPRRLYLFSLTLDSAHECAVTLALERFSVIASRRVAGNGELGVALRTKTVRGRLCRIRIQIAAKDDAVPFEASQLSIRCLCVALDDLSNPKTGSTHLAHWGWFQRSVHAVCKRSRFWNSLVSEIEMRLGREEILSLPQYMAVCPTGQCNASCGFCSVTINRTGIIKKQLPYEKLDLFLAPVSSSLRLFGLEGNGEPTLYERFDDLVQRVTVSDSPAYLITNGERLSREQILLLLASPVDSINVSLNAATPEIHRKIMRLKSFGAVLTNIRRLVVWRGEAAAPLLSVSLVVTHDNVHEVQRFLYLCEWILRVDRIHIRPLAELATEGSTFEDLRALVPYESDVEDMLDSVAEYLEATPRRAEIMLEPSNFRAFRADPIELDGSITSDGELCVPRSRYWAARRGTVQARWRLNELVIGDVSEESGIIYASCEVPLAAEKDVRLLADVTVFQGTLTIMVVGDGGSVLAVRNVGQNHDVPRSPVELRFNGGRSTRASIQLAKAEGQFDAAIEFRHLKSPRVAVSRDLRLPHARRWEVCSSEAQIRWNGSQVHVAWDGAAGPYLVKSYGFPCRAETAARLKVRIDVRSGALGIGILSEDASTWLRNCTYGRGHHDGEVVFETAKNRKAHVVLYSASEDPLDASVDWLDQLDALPDFLERKIVVDELRIPPAHRWSGAMSNASVEWIGARVLIRYEGSPHLYLAMSSRFPCVQREGFVQKASVCVDVKRGQLGIGFLGSVGFVAAFSFGPGQRRETLAVNTHAETELQVVLYALTHEPLDAEVDWGNSLVSELQLETPPELDFLIGRDEAECISERRLAAWDARPAQRGNCPAVEPPLKNGARRGAGYRDSDFTARPPGGDPVIGQAGLLRRVRAVYAREGVSGVAYRVMARLIPYLGSPTPAPSAPRYGPFVKRMLDATLGKPKIYCQKPWKDLHNYTVDGRMDVCCIATGASQEGHALGNMFKDDFQKVWNGASARRFRRTVNTDEKLFVCARCTMANNYKSAFD